MREAEIIRPPSMADGEHYQALDEAVSNVYIRAFRLTKAGVQIVGHAHPFAHISILCRGKAKVTVNGKDSIYDADAAGWPVLVYVEKDLRHEITALSDDVVWCCVHAQRDKEIGDVIDPDMVPDGIMTPELRAKLMPIVGRSDRMMKR